VVVVCGKNEHLLRVLTAEKRMLEDKAHRLLGIHVLGFVGNIDEWMVTSDLLVTKV
jgi:UDP-N-acetylglucosamine:LPS N-acetylglucosamine transferase